MTDSELDKKLNAARSPELEPDYAADFSRQVFAGIRALPVEKTAGRNSPANLWRRQIALGFSFAMFFLVAGFFIGHWHTKDEMLRVEKAVTPRHDLLADVKMINETLALFPNRVRAIVQNGHDGMQLVLADQPDVPNSPPLFVKICDGTNCSSLVTFSGQELEIAGQKITVLADGSGGIILEGRKFVWDNQSPNTLPDGLKIEAKNLTLRKL